MIRHKAKMLLTRDLEDMMMQDPVTSSCFLGVVARTELPSKIPIYPSGYGLPPNFYTSRFTKFLASHPGDTERNVGTLQALNSAVCGYYCMFYLFH